MSVYPAPASPDQPFGHRPNGAVDADTAVADPLDDLHFADFFQARAAAPLQALEAERLAAVKAFQRKAITAGALALVWCVVANFVWDGRLIVVPVGVAAWYLYACYKPLRALGAEAKSRLLTIISGALGFSYQLDGFQPPAYDRLHGMGLLPNSDRQTFDDLFSGERSKVGFGICDAHLECEELNGKSTRWVTVFRGQLIRIAFPKKFQAVTVIARDAGLLNMLHRPAGMQRVGLGASEFERDFEVYSTDQVEARFLVHPAFMEKLIDMEAAYQGSNLRGMFCEGELLLAVEGRDRFQFGDPFKPFDDVAQAQSVADDLGHVLGVIDFVLAGPPPAPELQPQA